MLINKHPVQAFNVNIPFKTPVAITISGSNKITIIIASVVIIFVLFFYFEVIKTKLNMHPSLSMSGSNDIDESTNIIINGSSEDELLSSNVKTIC